MSKRSSFRQALIGGVAAGVTAAYVVRQRQYAAAATRFRFPAGKALITGASTGIGACYAERLASLGYDVVLVARREAMLATLATTIQQTYGVKADYIAADLSTAAGMDTVVQRIKTGQDISFLVNNAGFSTTIPFSELDASVVDDMAQLHVLATAKLTRAALPYMIAQHAGTVVNVSSVMGYMAEAYHSNYCATKAYLNSLSGALAKEVGALGVTVQALCPGLTETDFHTSAHYDAWDKAAYPAFMWQTTDQVVTYSLQHIREGRSGVCITGWLNTLLVQVVRHHTVGRPLMRLFETVMRWVTAQTAS